MLKIDFQGISKRFGAVQANSEVTFTVQPGTIHALVGENGAGKSTLMKILVGLIPPDSGAFLLDGSPAHFRSTLDSMAIGIGMVYQHFMLVPTLNAWQNITLGHEPFWIDTQKIKERLKPLLETLHCSLDLEMPVGEMSIGQQQQVEILRALFYDSKVLIFDEPTAVLTPQEAEKLFHQIRALKAKGKTILIITHKLKEVLSLSDSITVLRNGKSVGTFPTHEMDEITLSEKMIGQRRIPLSIQSSEGPKREECLLEIQTLSTPHCLREPLRELSLEVHSHEIVGIAGVEGNGQKRLLECLAGIEKNFTGELRITGKGMGILPSDRLNEAVIPEFDLAENLILGHQKKYGPVFDWKNLHQKTEGLAKDYHVTPPDSHLQMRQLSGGNQQKFVVARELSEPIQLVIAAHPTRGVDIGACDFIHQNLLKLKTEGAGILLISSDLDELLLLSDRLLIIFDGKIVSNTPRGKLTANEIGLWMTGGGK